MKHRRFSYRIFLLVIFGAFLFLPLEKSFGYPVGSNNWHLNSAFQAENNADLVCKVHVLSIRQSGVIESKLFPGAPDVSRMIATSKVLSVIKGKCPKTIDIEFHYPKDRDIQLGHPSWLLYTELKQNEVCFVFLKESKPYYKLGRIKSKARVHPEVVDCNLGDAPNLRLLAEFLASCNSNNELIKLQAVEELGYLGDAMLRDIRSSPYRDSKEALERCLKIDSALSKAREMIRKMRSSEDLMIKSLSIISSFQVGVSPGIEGPLGLLRMNPSDFDPNDSIKKYGIRDFCISSLQLRLLQTMDHTTRRFLVNLKDRSVIKKASGSYLRGVPNFDYAGFCKQALEYKAVKSSKEMRDAIAHILWITDERFIR